MEFTNKKYSEEEIYNAYLEERKEAYGGDLKIIENSAKELIKILRLNPKGLRMNKENK